jgi:hypothetical protein
MMKKTAILLLVLLSFAPASFAEEGLLAKHGIKSENLDPAQEAFFEETINEIGRIQAKEITINPYVYYRLSTFRKLFGFQFDGEKLKEWVLHRIKSVTRQNTWTIAVNKNLGHLLLGDRFFEKSPFLERAYLLVHEARHSDGDGYRHVACPPDFKYVSAGSPDIDLTREGACDDAPDGAYGFQAAFLFELYARGIVDQQEAGLQYNSCTTRIIVREKK